MPEDTKKRNSRQYAWQKQNKDRINFTMQKGTKEEIVKAADQLGINPAEFIRQAIQEKLSKM